MMISQLAMAWLLMAQAPASSEATPAADTPAPTAETTAPKAATTPAKTAKARAKKTTAPKETGAKATAARRKALREQKAKAQEKAQADYEKRLAQQTKDFEKQQANGGQRRRGGVMPGQGQQGQGPQGGMSFQGRGRGMQFPAQGGQYGMGNQFNPINDPFGASVNNRVITPFNNPVFIPPVDDADPF